MDPYITHYPILAAAIAASKGSVLELGVGDGSTPMLHYMCGMMGRDLWSLDTDDAWLEKFEAYKRVGGHWIDSVDGWDEVLSSAYWRETTWGVVFVDCAPGEIRWELIKHFKDTAEFIIAHDSEVDHGAGGNYQYDKVKPLFKYVTEFRRFRPYTLILSNERLFEIEHCDQEWKGHQ